MKSISKEMFIMALLLMIVVFMLGMVFYKYMPNNKTVPEPISYSADSSTTAVLQEISASTGYGDNSNEDSVDDVIKSYSIGTQELVTAASKQTYVSGKTDPFAEYKDAPSADATGNTTANTSATNTTSAPSTTTDTNSTGTFFEKKDSK